MCCHFPLTHALTHTLIHTHTFTHSHIFIPLAPLSLSLSCKSYVNHLFFNFLFCTFTSHLYKSLFFLICFLILIFIGYLIFIWLVAPSSLVSQHAVPHISYKFIHSLLISSPKRLIKPNALFSSHDHGEWDGTQKK